MNRLAAPHRGMPLPTIGPAQSVQTARRRSCRPQTVLDPALPNQGNGAAPRPFRPSGSMLPEPPLRPSLVFCLQTKTALPLLSAWGSAAFGASAPRETTSSLASCWSRSRKFRYCWISRLCGNGNNSRSLVPKPAVRPARGWRLRLLVYAFDVLAQLCNGLFEFSDTLFYRSQSIGNFLEFAFHRRPRSLGHF